MWKKTCKNCYYNKYPTEGYLKCMHCILKPENAVGVLNFKPIEEEKEIMKYNDYSVNVKFECKINKKITLDAETSEKAAREIMKELSDPDILDKMVKHIKEKMLCDKDATVSIYLRQVEAKTIKKKPLILLCGKSGSGKTTVANLLQSKYGLKQLESYTTRPQRKPDERGHIWSSMDVYNIYKQTPSNIIAETEINGHKYWATSGQLDNADVYVIDPKTALELAEKVKDERSVMIIYLYCSERTRLYRMVKRGDELADINARDLRESCINRDWDDCISCTTPGQMRLAVEDYTLSDVVEIIKARWDEL